MLNNFNASQYKKFHSLKRLRHTCRRIEKGAKIACYRILSFDTNCDTVGVIYADEAKELRKIIEYKMRKLVQEVMSNKRYHIERLKSYEEVNAELARSCEKVIEVLGRIKNAIRGAV